METVAPEFPDTHFVIIDAVVDQPNVRSIVFNEHEGSYLVGMLAAMASKTGKVGFVGGMDIPLIRKFACGYVAGRQGGEPGRRGLPEHDRHHRRGLERPGARAASSPRARSTAAPTSSTTPPAAPASACCRRRRTPASSASASTPTRTTCIPGQVLTSMLKRVDVATYNAMMDVQNGKFTPGVAGAWASPRTASAMRSTRTTRR